MGTENAATGEESIVAPYHLPKSTSAGQIYGHLPFRSLYMDTSEKAGYVDVFPLTHHKSKFYSRNSFLPTSYGRYIVLMETFHWLGAWYFSLGTWYFSLGTLHLAY